MQVYPTLTSFSNGYYLVEDLLVQPTEDIDTPRIHEYFYELIQDNYYGDHPTPMLFKNPKSTFYFDVEPATGLATDAMEIPYGFFEDFDESDAHTGDEMLLAKPRHAQQIYHVAELATKLAD